MNVREQVGRNFSNMKVTIPENGLYFPNAGLSRKVAFYWTRFLLPHMVMINGRLRNHPITSTEKRCYKALYDKQQLTLTIFAGCSDMLYIPRRFALEFAELFALFSEYDMWLEIAVPTIVQCLSGEQDWERLNSHYIHFNEINFYNYDITTFMDRHFNHPMKWSHLDKNDTHSLGYKPFFCDEILPLLFKQNK